MPKQRTIILPPNLRAFSALTFDAIDEPAILNMMATMPGIQGVRLTVHDDGQWATVEATDGENGAVWTTPWPPIVDGSAPQAEFPDLSQLVPTVPPLLVVRLDAYRLAKVAAAAAEVCGPGGAAVELRIYRAGTSPARPDGPAPVIIAGVAHDGGTFLGFLQPIVADPPNESTT